MRFIAAIVDSTRTSTQLSIHPRLQRACLPAIDIKDCALAVGRLWRCQKRHCARNLGRVAEARHARCLRDHFDGGRFIDAVLGSKAIKANLQSISSDRAGVDRVHAHAIAHAAISQHLGEVEQRGIDRAANRELGAAGAPAYADDVSSIPLAN